MCSTFAMDDDPDIDALAAQRYASGADAIDVAAERVAGHLETRDEVIASRVDRPGSFPLYGPSDKDTIARRIVANLLNAGWSPPTPERVHAAAQRTRDFNKRHDEWWEGLSENEQQRALDHFNVHNEWPPDLSPPE